MNNSRTGQNTQCDWVLTEAATGQAQCSVWSQEGIATNVNRCVDTNVCLTRSESDLKIVKLIFLEFLGSL